VSIYVHTCICYGKRHSPVATAGEEASLTPEFWGGIADRLALTDAQVKDLVRVKCIGGLSRLAKFKLHSLVVQAMTMEHGSS
jgi:hypothetical protein